MDGCCVTPLPSLGAFSPVAAVIAPCWGNYHLLVYVYKLVYPVPAINIIKLHITPSRLSPIPSWLLTTPTILFDLLQSDMMHTKNVILPVTCTSVNTMKYEVCIHNISHYLQMDRNKVIILKLLLSLNLTLLPNDFQIQFLYTLLNCMPYF